LAEPVFLAVGFAALRDDFFFFVAIVCSLQKLIDKNAVSDMQLYMQNCILSNLDELIR
jgi:hypothetical protein